MTSHFRPIWVIPCYRHEIALSAMLPKLRGYGFPILVVDDGNPIPLTPVQGVNILRCAKNQGKGGALIAGAEWAAQRGYTHLVQIDADGQHALADAYAMIQSAQAAPDTLFSGFPVYDASAPIARSKGRAITRFFLWLETGIKREDGLCGCRVYPLAAFLKVSRYVWSRRMGFDVEVIVKWAWQGYPIRQCNVHVTYPLDGHSNFHMVRDNLAFFALHTRLCCLRILRLLRLKK